METKQAFKILSKICLNNWHYIDRKVLSLNREVNFFTGHSGSGKSTVIDALQIVLYANTDGRGFFNKAAAEKQKFFQHHCAGVYKQRHLGAGVRGHCL